ncbi:MAG TPA: glycoside hydrolase family 130 protein [Dongiaceae bacterium]|nr:glycoside hydrolase family 130 protein [Dongiaceae bacterium]
MKSHHKLFVGLTSLVLAAAGLSAQPGNLPDWGLGPLIRPAEVNPVIRPDTNSVFYCPMRGQPVHWEALHTFNPAAVVKDGQVWVLYRAEDDSGAMAIGQHTSRLGLAISSDGLHFERGPAPVFYPAEDNQKANEWDGGCEDPRLVETEDGTYVLMYTQWNRKVARLAVATSRNLLHWTKYGPALTNFDGFCKSGAILCRPLNGKLVAAKIDGKYWMYWGEGAISCASSVDLIHWDAGPRVLPARKGKFDSALAEAGPPAVVTSKGIVLLYNGKNDAHDGDSRLAPNAYAVGEALFNPQHPDQLLARTDSPVFQPEAAFERTGQYASGTTFMEGLVLFHDQYFAYYGCADSLVAVAVAPAR